MRKLARDLIPNAPQIGLYVAPDIPGDKLRNAIADYGSGLAEEDVLALYDATLIGNGKDGALFTADRVVFQNNNLEPIQQVAYADIVGVARKRRLFSGRRVLLQVNRGRATFELTMDFSGRPKAADFVARFLQEAMTAEPGPGDAGVESTRVEDASTAREPESSSTDIRRVRHALARLRDEGVLAQHHYEAMLRVVGNE